MIERLGDASGDWREVARRFSFASRKGVRADFVVGEPLAIESV
jgi:hypothetical protein